MKMCNYVPAELESIHSPEPLPGWIFLPTGNDYMDRVNVFPFYEMAYRVHPLGEIAEGEKLKDWQQKLWAARVWVEWLTQDRFIPLGVCRSVALELVAAINTAMEAPKTSLALLGVANPAPAQPDDKEFTWLEAYNVRDGVRKFETVLAAELETMSIYFVSRKLAYDTNTLIEDASKLLPPNLKFLPDEINAEFLQLGKCIAFDIPTAAGFHTIRATEAVIRKYYKAITGKDPKPKLRNWGAYIRNLEKAGADANVTSFLDHIRENYRNPVLHPEVTLGEDEAQILLGVCTSAIVMMSTAITKIEEARQAATGDDAQSVS